MDILWNGEVYRRTGINPSDVGRVDVPVQPPPVAPAPRSPVRVDEAPVFVSLTVLECAACFGVSIQAVRYWLKTGRIDRGPDRRTASGQHERTVLVPDDFTGRKQLNQGRPRKREAA